MQLLEALSWIVAIPRHFLKERVMTKTKFRLVRLGDAKKLTCSGGEVGIDFRLEPAQPTA